MLIVVAFLKIIFGRDIVVVLCLLDDFLKFLTQVIKTQLNLFFLNLNLVVILVRSETNM